MYMLVLLMSVGDGTSILLLNSVVELMLNQMHILNYLEFMNFMVGLVFLIIK